MNKKLIIKIILGLIIIAGIVTVATVGFNVDLLYSNHSYQLYL